MPAAALSAVVPTAVGDRGEPTANLQALLARLDVGALPDEEAADATYGAGTERLVAILQERLGLDVPVQGTLGTESARAFNELAAEQGIFNVVEGAVFDALGAPAAGVALVVFDVDNAALPCATALTDAEGHYLAWYDPRFYVAARPGVDRRKDAVDLVVATPEGDRSETAFGAGERLQIDLRLAAVEAASLRVRGRVVDAAGRPIPNVTVQVFDRDIGVAPTRLGPDVDPVTDDAGAFSVAYARTRVEEGDAAPVRADLVFALSAEDVAISEFSITRLRAQEDDVLNGELPVPASEQRLGLVARDDEVVRLTVAELAGTLGPSEFDRLVEKLAPLTTHRPIAEFDEAGSLDVTFAAREIGEDRERLEDLVTAHRLALAPFRQDVAPAILYALARTLGARNARSLAARTVTELAEAIGRAAKARTIGAPDRDATEIASELHALAVRDLLQPVGEPPSTMDAALATVIPNADLRAELVAASVDADGDSDQFWRDVARDHPDLAVEPVQYALHLTTLADGSAPLIEAIQRELPAATTLRALALELDDARLDELLATSQALPADRLDGESDDDARARLGAQVRSLLQAAHPTSVVARMARGWTAERPDAVPSASAELLERAVRRTDFDLARADVEQFVADRAGELFDVDVDEGARAAAAAGVLRIQRLFRVSGGPDELSLLTTRSSATGAPFLGAVDIARYGEAAFLAHFPDVPAETRTALAQTHRRARSMVDTVAGLMIAQHQDRHDLLPAGAADHLAKDAPIASWTDFFGSVEQCDCDECRSVTGAAAYLVDSFEFLDKRCAADARGITPLDRLIGHPTKTPADGAAPGIPGLRPDLAHIKLTCENVNTTIPTIDLINEILESVVAFGQTTPLETGEDGARHERPNEPSPGVTGRELSAAPEHVVEEAYRLLSQAVYPIWLPYDRLLATARAHFEQAGTSRAEALATFAAGSPARIGAETLGLLARDYEILTGTTFAGEPAAPLPLPELFGFDSEGAPPGDAWWTEPLSVARAAMTALALSFEDLVALIRTRFMGGLVPDAEDPGTAARLLLDVDQLAELRAADYAVAPGSPIAEALELGGLTGEAVRAFVDAHPGSTIVLDPPLSCDPDAIRLRHLDGSELTGEEWLRMHRFARLARRMKVGPAELDVALPAGGLDAASLLELAEPARLRDALGVSWAQAAALVADIPEALYDELFVRSGLARVHPLFRRDAGGAVLGTPATIADGAPALASAFEVELETLLAAASRLELTRLDLAAVSELYRVTLLAAHLGLAPLELVEYRAGLEKHSVLDLVQRVRRLATAGLSAAHVSQLTARPIEELGAVLDALGAALAAVDERDARELAEEAARVDSVLPFSAAEIVARASARAQARDSVVASVLAPALALDPAVLAEQFATRPELQALLQPVPEPERAAAVALLAGLDRIGRLLSAVGLGDELWRAAVTSPSRTPDDALAAIFDGTDPTAVVAVLEDLALFGELAAQTRRPAALAATLRALSSGDPAWTSLASAWLAVDGGLVGAAAPPAPGDRPLVTLAELRDRVRVARRLGRPADQMPALLAEPISSTDLATLVAGVAGAYPASSWADVSRKLADPIREASRDALVGHLVHREGLASPDQLFERYLTDPQINSFVLTSRVRQAIFAVQTYVQRCRLGLVPGVAPEQIAAEWESVSSLPVWAARMQTLLWPEWILEPSWRDNKTRLFGDLESGARQADVTPASVTRAYEQYLADLRTVSSAEVCGTFLQTVFTAPDDERYRSVLHVVARTRGAVPRRYFYRRQNRYAHSQEWTDWEPIQTDIQGVEQDRMSGRKATGDASLPEPGVHVLPVVWRGQVHLFWPTIVRKIDAPDSAPVIDATKPNRTRFSQPYWELKLNWTRRDGPGWTPAEQSSALVETWWGSDTVDYIGMPTEHGVEVVVVGAEPVPRFPDLSRLTLKAALVPDTSLSIVVCERETGGAVRGRFAFTFERLASEMRVAPTDAVLAGDHPELKGAVGSFMGVQASGALRAVGSPAKPEGDVLFSAPGKVRLTTLNQGFGATLDAPMFADLGDSSYLLTLAPGATTVRQELSAPPKNSIVALEGRHSLLEAVAATLPPHHEPNPWLATQAMRVDTSLRAALQSSGATAQIELGAAHAASLPSYRWVGVPAVDVTVVPFSNPFVDRFQSALRVGGLEALLAPETQRRPLDAAHTFAVRCKPNPERTVAPAVELVDFAADAPYSVYHWELFFEIPRLLMKLLGDNHQRAAALRMGEYIYSPLHASSDPRDAWRFEGLRDVEALRLDDLLARLQLPAQDPARRAVEAQVEAMRLFPFQGHRIARLRPVAFKKWMCAETVKLYLASCDDGLRQFTPETVNQAFQYALIASAIMGPAPQAMRPRVAMAPRSYAELRPDLDALGNVMLTAESKLAPMAANGVGDGSSSPVALGLVQRGAIGYFGIPSDQKLLALWADVADRLFKLRNGMNLDGVQIQLPLFPPRLDPAVLAEMVAGGLDLGAALEELAAERPRQRFGVAYREAVAAAQSLIDVGEKLLQASTQRDGEALARLNASAEQVMSDLVVTSRERQRAQAESEKRDAEAQREGHLTQWRHFRDLLGLDPAAVPEPGPDRSNPDTVNSGVAVPARPLKLVDAGSRPFDLDVIPGLLSVTLASVQGTVLEEEQQELEASFKALQTTYDAAQLESLAAVLGLIPDFEGAAKPLGAGFAVHFGGQALSAIARAAAGNKNTNAGMHRFVAQVYGKQASVVLRERDWVAGLNHAAAACREVDQRVKTAELRIAVFDAEVAVGTQMAKHAVAVERHLKEKFTKTELFDWRIGRLRELFRRTAAVAFGCAKDLNACYRAERDPLERKSFITVPPPRSAAEELLTGQELMVCLQEMQRSYLATADQGPEVVQHFALSDVDPWALHSLRETGVAEFSLPEVLFDLDHAGHYDRRIRSVQLSVPCLTGPMSGVSGTLTLTGARRRARATGELLDDSLVGVTSIALSTGRDDAGRFELRLDGEAYLPCEGLGAISDWKLVFPQAFRKFNYRDVTDVFVTLRVVAKDAGEQFAAIRSAKLKAALNALTSRGQAAGPYRLISMRHDRPDEWAAYQAGAALSVPVTAEVLPFVLRQEQPALKDAQAIRLPKLEPALAPVAATKSGRKPAWTLSLAADDVDPATLDDIVFLARFEL